MPDGGSMAFNMEFPISPQNTKYIYLLALYPLTLLASILIIFSIMFKMSKGYIYYIFLYTQAENYLSATNYLAGSHLLAPFILITLLHCFYMATLFKHYIFVKSDRASHFRASSMLWLLFISPIHYFASIISLVIWVSLVSIISRKW